VRTVLQAVAIKLKLDGEKVRCLKGKEKTNQKSYSNLKGRIKFLHFIRSAIADGGGCGCLGNRKW
jgi:hypothetical protein